MSRITVSKRLFAAGVGLACALPSPPNVQKCAFAQGTNERADSTQSPNETRSRTELQPRGDRILGMGISEGATGFPAAFALAQDVGVEVVEIPAPWDDYEPTPGAFSGSWLAIANQFYPRMGTKIALSLNPIDTNNLRLPKDLKGKSFRDAEVIERFKQFVDFAASTVADSDVFYVAIGNEIDAYLGNLDARWQDYTAFVAAVAPHVRNKFPGAAVSSKNMFGGLTRLHDKVMPLVNEVDVVLATYYPFKSGGFVVANPAVVHEDFKKLIDLYPGKKVYFAEIGYPSGALNESSGEQQAEFIRETFAAWDEYSERIPFLNFIWLHDASPASVAGWQKYYGLTDKAFASYLATLGLRTFDGKDKRAFTELRKQTAARRWREKSPSTK